MSGAHLPRRDPGDRVLDHTSLGRLVSAHGSDLAPTRPLGGSGMTCPRCQQDNPSHAKFCLECGAPLGSTSESGPSGAPHAELQRALTEAVQQQTATSEILRVISSSPTDYQPVFETIVRNAARLCHATSSLIWLLEGDRFRVVAPYSVPPDSPSEIGVADAPNLFRVIHDGTTHHVADIENDPRVTPGALNITRAMGARAVLQAPMVRDREVIGALTVLRDTPGMFASGQVELLKTFADQAVIAIENVRLFKELEARNRDLTATSDILQVISSSPTDVQPVFEAIADSGMRLFDAQGVTVVRYDGELISIAAARGGILGSATASIERFRAPHRPTEGFPPEQAVVTKTMRHVSDVATDLSCSEEFRRHARERGFRSVLAIPVLRGGDPVGAIVVSRAQAGPFSTAEIELVHTFADQAVIAIENARLFNETKEALEQQTATSEILRVISNSPTDIQPV